MSIVLTREQVRRVDRLAMERYTISGLVMMENAGRHAAEIILDEFGPGGRVLICCGAGNNGGDGCVIARHLHNAGCQVRLFLAGDGARMSADMEANFRIVQAMGLVWKAESAEPTTVADTIGKDEVVVDALLGTGFHGEVRSPIAELIEAVNTSVKRATVAVDVPSGLDCDTGIPAQATICADLTVTFVAEKPGFSADAAAPYIGRVAVADIGVPRELVADILRGAT